MKKIFFVTVILLLTFSIAGASDEIVLSAQESESGSFYGEITDITQGKDGKQIQLTNTQGEVYSTAVSMISDTIKNGSFEELYMGTRVNVLYTQKDITSHILISNSLEIISQGLSDNDKDYFKVLGDRIDMKFKNTVESTLEIYKTHILKYSKQKQLYVHNSMIDKVEMLAGNLLLEYPQDIELPEDINEKYSRLMYVQFALKELDFFQK